MGKETYAYENFSLRNIKGELWKPVPGFEGLYEISSFGRVKTLKRTYVNNIGATVAIKERILKARLISRKSKTVPHESHAVTVGLCLNGRKQMLYVGRMVYYVFVEKFDLQDRSILISYKDWDGRNIRPANLCSSSISAIMQVSHDNERYKTVLSQNSKTISQYDLEGNLIRSYESIIAAGKFTGLSSSNIARAANGKTILYKGYRWRFGKRHSLPKIKVKKEKDGGVNLLLMQESGMALYDRANVPPVADLRLKNLKGEKWKDITGFSGYYQVSNYGRVKALSRLYVGAQQHLRPEFIKSLHLKFGRQNDRQTNFGVLCVTLYKEMRRTSHSVARLVYNNFVKALDLNDKQVKITYYDGNSMNLHYKNLAVKAGK